LDQAAQVASTPYQAYTGQLVAPTNQQQQTGIGTINQYATAGVPYLQTAEGLQQSAANPLTSQQIQQYYSPYQQDVVNATEAQFNNQNAQQQQQVLGNAAAQGALGGDRTAVAQSVLAGQQQAQEAPVIAGLENQGYTQALQTAGQQFQQNPEQAAYGIASTGNAIENAGLTGANAQVGAGTLEQQTQQAQDTAAYQQFEQALQYPFATLGWEAGIDTGVGSQMGGTSSTTAPPPNYMAQLLGAGLGAGAAVLSTKRAKENLKKIGRLNDGQSVYRFNYKGNPTTRIGLVAEEVERNHPEAIHQINGWKSVDYDEATKDAVRRLLGGRVQGLAMGGSPYGESGGMPYAAGIGWVPTMNITGGSGAPKPPNAPNQQQQAGIQSPAQMATNAAKIASSPGIGSAFNTGTTELASGMNASDLSALTGEDADVSSAALAAMPFGENRGGRIPRAYGGLAIPHNNRIQLKNGGPPVRAGLGMASFMPRRRFADGGSPDDDVVNFPSDRFVQPPVPAGLYNNSSGDANPLENILKFQTYGQASPYAPAPQGIGETSRSDESTDLPPQITGNAPRAGIGTQALGFADDGSRNAAPVASPDSVNAAPESVREPETASQKGFGLLGLLSPDVGMSALSAGLGMMASRSPFLGTAIGEGGLQGLSTYGSLQQQHLAQQKQQQDVDLKVRQLDQAAKAEQDRIAQESKKEQFAETGISAADRAKLAMEQAKLTQEQNQPKTLTPGQQLVNPKTGEVIGTNESGLMSDAAVNLAVDRIHAGDPAALQNLGRGAQTGQNLVRIQNRLAERAAAEGWSGADLAAAKANFTSQSAAASTAAKRSANVDAAVEEAKQTFPLALQASAALPRSDWVPINKLEQMIQAGTSDPRYIRYSTALQGAMTAYSQAMSRTGTNSVYAQQAAHDLLARATGPEGIQAALEQMGQEMEAAKVAPEIVRQAILARISGKGAPAATTMPTTGAPGSSMVPTAATKPAAMQSNGWIYKLQPDGSYNDPSPQKGG
jgi:hypothetical protein